MKVTGWGHFNYDYDKEGIEKQPELWDIAGITEEEYEKAIIDEIRKNNYKFDGTYHQYGDHGTPIIDGKYYVTCSMRHWGSIMAKAWDDDSEQAYCVYAWSYNEPDRKVPNGSK